MFRRILPQAKHLSEEVIEPGDIVIDATCGNGHDTKFLADAVGSEGTVFSFDIQAQAIANAKDLCRPHNNIEFILDSHANLGRYIPKDAPIRAAMFNLGYLPKGDKEITTVYESTSIALSEIFDRLTVGGRIIIVVYHGHPSGKIERDKLLASLSHWSQKEAQVLKYQFINQKNDAPFLLCVEKISMP